MNRNSIALLLALVSSIALATDLRIYPTFTEVQQPARPELTFPSAQWRWIQPASFSVRGVPSPVISVRPAELDWLRTQEGKDVTWAPPGRPPLAATLERVDDLLLRLATGEYVNAQHNDLIFSEKPPLQGGVTLTLTGVDTAKNPVLVYRTQALFWRPRYELTLNGEGATLAALAQLSNLSDEVFTAQNVDLYGGSVQNQSGPFSQPGALALPNLPTAGQTSASLTDAGMNPVMSAGEVRGLQRYTLPSGLQLGRGESLTLPFLKPASRDFARYASVQSSFDAQNHSGAANRHYKFTSSLSLPTGPVDVREGGVLVGSVQLPAVQAGKPVDLDLGTDAELRYEKTVKRTGAEKNDRGLLLSTTYQVTYRFVSTKVTATQVSVREQLYGRSVSVDVQAAQNGQVMVNRQVELPANGKATLTFKLKFIN